MKPSLGRPMLLMILAPIVASSGCHGSEDRFPSAVKISTNKGAFTVCKDSAASNSANPYAITVGTGEAHISQRRGLEESIEVVADSGSSADFLVNGKHHKPGPDGCITISDGKVMG